METWLDQWRDYLARRGATDPFAVETLEDRLRQLIDGLAPAGLSTEETFLIAVRRLGAHDPETRAFAREATHRLVWKPLPRHGVAWREAMVAFGLALLAALAIKLPALFGIGLEDDPGFYARNAALFVLPLLTAYFAWKRATPPRTRYALAAALVVAAVCANLHAFAPGDPLEALLALHLPIALWLGVGIAHAGGRWREVAARMDFVRFSGELFVYYVLIALGGTVLTGFTFALFRSIGVDAEPFFQDWMLPCGAMGAVIVAAWLVETRQGVAGTLAPMLTRLFTPLFALLLIAFLVAMSWTGRGPGFQREMLIAFDLLLAVVVGLLLYSLAGRPADKPPAAFDVLQIVLVIAALLVDIVALGSIAGRIDELGPTPNRIAALGENLILLVNLAGSAWLYLRFVRGRGSPLELERWQVRFLPVYAAWAAIVVVVFPLLFR